jgi:NADPH:quinone reductase-like Zn-dependent oxidoreductase
VRLATNVKKGQVVLITGALGSVGRAAVHTAKKIGAQVVAGVRGNELYDARSLSVSYLLEPRFWIASIVPIIRELLH